MNYRPLTFSPFARQAARVASVCTINRQTKIAEPNKSPPKSAGMIIIFDTFWLLQISTHIYSFYM